jgi:hypothetical protein
MKKVLLSLLFLGLGLSGKAQYLVSGELTNTVSAQVLVFVNPAALYDVNSYKIIYNTTDIDGTPTTASGALMVPVNSGCDLFPLVSYSHGTVLERENVPSRNNNESFIPKILASTGRIAVAADYLGLGDNPGLHPYLHAESQATASIDLMRAAREFIQDSLNVSLNGEVFVTGYSQGGHAAMATAKYIQDNSLNSEFNIVGAGPASGPYNLSGTQAAVLVSDQPYSNPGYVCYLLFGLNRVYGNIYNNYSDILKSPYDVIIPPYFDGTFPMDSVNARLPAKLSDFMQDTVLANFKNDSVGRTHPLWQALLKNDNYDWTPNFPMELYYCTLDEQVDFNNSIDAANQMTLNGSSSVVAVNQGALDHGGCVVPAIGGALSFFETLDTECVMISLEEQLRKGLISLYPNPAQSYFSVDGLEAETASVIIYDLNGRPVLERNFITEEHIAIDHLKSGIYLVRIISGNETATTKMLIE